jgi:hypothetical protein
LGAAVLTTTPGRAERVAGWTDLDGDVAELIGDTADVASVPDASPIREGVVSSVEGPEADATVVRGASSVREGVVSSVDEPEADAAVELVEDESEDDDIDPPASPDATPQPNPAMIAAPIPKATANPPTRPTYAA